MPQITEALAAFIQLPKGVDFDAIDNQPVDLAFAMLVPQEATDEHLQLLAKLAQMFDDQAFCTTLREASSANDLYQLILQREAIISA
jgi:PTS system nitrogen regulatory IIA component